MPNKKQDKSYATKADVKDILLDFNDMVLFPRLTDLLDKRFGRVDEQFTKVDEQFKRVDERFISIDEQFKGVHEQLAKTDELFGGIAVEFAKIERQFEQVNERFEKQTYELKVYIDRKLEHGMVEMFDRLEKKAEREGKFHQAVVAFFLKHDIGPKREAIRLRTLA